MRIVNGEIVLDTSSLQIDRHADAARDADEMEQVEENLLTRKINSASFGKRTKVESWDMEMTNLFYRGLRMFGTDFMMISKMFPGRSRRQIKLKFSNEERKNPDRIKQTLLGPRETVTLEDYSDMTNTVYDDPKIIEQELAAEKRKIEEEHEKQIQAAKDQLLRNPAKPNVLPSIEGGGVHTGNRRQFGHGRAVRAVGGGGTEQVLGSIDDF
jgi:transcription factor TFIIIB component B''